MKAILCIPRPPLLIPHAQPGFGPVDSKHITKFPLTHSTEHPSSHYGIGVLLDGDGGVFDGFMFRYLRDTLSAWIDTDEPHAVAASLGVPWQDATTFRDALHEPGIGQPPANRPAPRSVYAGIK